MDLSEPSNQPTPRFNPELVLKGNGRQSRQPEPDRIRAVRWHQICDGLTEALLYFMVVFNPWAFGATQTWSIWTMNLAGYGLGGLLMAKWIIRWRTGYRPARWGDPIAAEGLAPEFEKGVKTKTFSDWLTISLAVLTGLILAYCLVSALNARATYYHGQMRFVYHDCIRWLPHSYDSQSTWFVFWEYLGLGLSFWAVRDWLLGKTRAERQSELEAQEQKSLEPFMSPSRRPRSASASMLPARLRRCLWVMCINAAVLGLEGILQRMDGTNRLLWLVEPRLNKTADTQFGPYAYRSNAAQYFNLMWPVCLGFWWSLRRPTHHTIGQHQRVGAGPHILLLPCVILLAACPIVTISRGGAIIAAANLVLAMTLLIYANRRGNPLIPLSMLLIFTLTLGLGGYLAWDKLKTRFATVFTDRMSLRLDIYENARSMVRDYPTFGTGPGTFAPLYQLYVAPERANQRWEAYVHDDWLETRATFGMVGYGLILAALGVAVIRWWYGGEIKVPWVMPAMISLALAGCLVHAKFDFPFQVHSVLSLFILQGSILFSFRRE